MDDEARFQRPAPRTAAITTAMLALAWGFVLPVSAHATLDPTFGLRGVARGADLRLSYAPRTGMVLDRRDRALVAVNESRYDESRPPCRNARLTSDGIRRTDPVAIRRFTTRGRVDRRFGVGGVARIDVDPCGATAHDMALGSDGALLLAVQPATGSPGALVKLTQEGVPLRSFGRRGIKRIMISPVAVEPDGVGGAYVLGHPDGRPSVVKLIRLTRAGVHDRSFAPGPLELGTVTYSTGDTAVPEAMPDGHDIRSLPDGRLIVVLSTRTPGAGLDTRAVRLDSRGRQDDTFGTDGVAVVRGGTNAVALQRDGKLLIGARTIGDKLVHRLLSDGGVDPSFGVRGTVTIPPRQSSTIMDIAVRRDGRIAVVHRNGDSHVTLLAPEGTLDRRFGAGGTASAVQPAYHDMADSVAFQRNGDIVLGGMSSRKASGHQHMAIRFRAP